METVVEKTDLRDGPRLGPVAVSNRREGGASTADSGANASRIQRELRHSDRDEKLREVIHRSLPANLGG